MPDPVTSLDKRKLIAAIPKDELLDAMPPMLRSIADASSCDAALALGSEYGGRRFHFPSAAGETTLLARCVGARAAERIVAVFGGVYADLPTVKFLKKLIVKHSSAPANHLAEALDVTERYVRMIRAEQKQRCPANTHLRTLT